MDTLIPETRLIQLLSGAEMERVRRNRGDFILKRTDSHMGRHVIFGCILDQQKWEDFLREVPAQRRSPESRLLSGWCRGASGPENTPCWSTPRKAPWSGVPDFYAPPTCSAVVCGASRPGGSRLRLSQIC